MNPLEASQALNEAIEAQRPWVPDPTAARRARTMNKQRRWAEEMQECGWSVEEPSATFPGVTEYDPGRRPGGLRYPQEVLPCGYTRHGTRSWQCTLISDHDGEHQAGDGRGWVRASWQ